MWAIVDRFLTSLGVSIIGIFIGFFSITDRIEQTGEDISGFICVIGIGLLLFGVFLFIRSILFTFRQLFTKFVLKEKMLCRDYGWTTGFISMLRNDYVSYTSASKKTKTSRMICRIISLILISIFIVVFVIYIFINDINSSPWPIYIGTILLMIGILLFLYSSIFEIGYVKGSDIRGIKCSQDLTMEQLFEEIRDMDSIYGKPRIETVEDILSPVIMFGPDFNSMDFIYIHKNRKGNRLYIGNSISESFTFDENTLGQEKDDIYAETKWTQKDIYKEVKKIVEYHYQY